MKYRVHNSLTGENVEFETISDAGAARQQFIDECIKDRFGIYQEIDEAEYWDAQIAAAVEAKDEELESHCRKRRQKSEKGNVIWMLVL